MLFCNSRTLFGYSGLLWGRLLRLRLHETRIEFHQPRSQDVNRRDPELNEITDMFCAVYSYKGKTDLSKVIDIQKRKLEVATHFSEIIEVQ